MIFEFHGFRIKASKRWVRRNTVYQYVEVNGVKHYRADDILYPEIKKTYDYISLHSNQIRLEFLEKLESIDYTDSYKKILEEIEDQTPEQRESYREGRRGSYSNYNNFSDDYGNDVGCDFDCY